MRDEQVLDRQLRDPEFRRLFQEEKLILDVTEQVSQALEERQLSRADLSRLLGKTRGYVTQVLSGSTNLTLRTVADVMTALGFEMGVSREPLKGIHSHPVEWKPSQGCIAFDAEIIVPPLPIQQADHPAQEIAA